MRQKSIEKPQILLAIAAMSSGLSLVFSLITLTPLLTNLLLLYAFAAFALWFKWSRASTEKKRLIQENIKVGLATGLCATFAYDISRLLVVFIGNLNVWPFETFPLFGYLIMGQSASEQAAYIVGTLYHFLNGMMFTVAYCFIWGEKGLFFGLLWGLGLEAAMLTLYPGWLDIQAIMTEFTIVSMTGHIIYGLTLGYISQKWLVAMRYGRESA